MQEENQPLIRTISCGKITHCLTTEIDTKLNIIHILCAMQHIYLGW